MANRAEEVEDDDPPPGSYITHLYPSDCPNIMSTMKALVTGFVDRPPNGQDSESHNHKVWDFLAECCVHSTAKTDDFFG